ncbi:MAG: winged helix-turn-helix domain-containing protein [Pyrinomonadaceae bacterium]
MSNRILQYEFENYILLPSERLLLQNGQSIPLKSKVFETLLTLVVHHGQLLTKEELMEKIWCESFVEEGNLTQNIFILRKIFGENPRDHRFIVTVPGQGYSFVAKVREVSETNNRILISENGHSSNGHIKSLAILPLKFLLLRESADKEHLGLAIADSLITHLSTNHSVSIRPTEAVLKYAETEKDAITIGRELDVDTVLSGTIQSSGEKVRANIQLHDVKNGDLLWANRFEVQTGDLFDLQDQISDQAALALATKIIKDPAVQKTLKDSEIYQTYLKYRFFWETRTEQGLLTSLEGAQKIVAAEPNFPLGYIGIADSYLLLGHHLYLAPNKIYPAIREAVSKALELDPNLAEAYATQADYCFITKDWLQAEKMHQLSIKLKPNYASERHWYGWFLTAMGRFDEALEQIEKAQSFDTNSLYLGVVRGVPLFYKRLFDQAIKQFQLVLEIDPNHNRARYYLALALFHSGQRVAGTAEFERVVAAEPLQQTMALLGYCYGMTGRHLEARALLGRINQIACRRYVSPYIRAYLHIGLGEKAEALTLLEEAYEENSLWLVWLNVDMQLQSLHDEPRFKKLLQKLNFPT